MNNPSKLLIALLGMFSFLHVDAMTIRGKVVDSSTRPLPFASVSINELKYASSANQQGEFSIGNVSRGEYTLQVSCIGYATKRVVVIVDNEDVSVDVSLEEESIVLDEVVVASTDMLQMIIVKTAANAKLKRKLNRYDATATCRIESVGNLDEWPKDFRQMIRIAMSLVGYKKIFNAFEAHSQMMIEMQSDISFYNGNIHLSDKRISASGGQLTAAEQAAFLKKKWEMDKNMYDELYYMLHRLYKKHLKGKSKETLRYAGAYDEEGRRIHVVSSESYEFHIVSDCWQIVKMSYRDSKQKRDIICKEYQRDLYLPIYYHWEDITELDPECSWTMTTTISYNYK